MTIPTSKQAPPVHRAEGLLLVDKPAGVTSNDMILAARRAYDERSIGHLGTLDPFATGLLLLLFGRSTRLATFITTEPKVYEAEIRFGSETDTDDATGAVTRTAQLPESTRIHEAIRELTGDLMQTPPAYSAKSVGGERAYDSARRGEYLDLAPVPVRVNEWKITREEPGLLAATISCGSGTYIRALARDLGRLSGSAAHLQSLRRIRCGEFDVRDAATLEQLRESPPTLRPLSVVAGNA